MKTYPESTKKSLQFEISNYTQQIQNFVNQNKDDENYAKFLYKFLIHVPLNYDVEDNISYYSNLAQDAFNFFRYRGNGKRKLDIKSHDNGQSVLTIMINDNNKHFLADSILNTLSELLQSNNSLYIHPLIHTVRDINGNLIKIIDDNNVADDNNDVFCELLVYARIVGNFDNKFIEMLSEKITTSLNTVDEVYTSWPNFLIKINDIINNLESKINQNDSRENIEYLKWLKSDHFTFLGYCQYNFAFKELKEIGSTNIWANNQNEIIYIINCSKDQKHLDDTIILGKINCTTTIQKHTLLDYVLVKDIDSNGNYISCTLIIGIYGTSLFYQSVNQIPMLRQKLLYVVNNSGFNKNNYNIKSLKMIVESLPKEEVMQNTSHDLYCMCMHILSAMRTHQLQVFIKEMSCNQYINVLIFMPRARFTPKVQQLINEYLMERFSSNIITSSVKHFSQNFLHIFYTLSTNVKNLEHDIEGVREYLDIISENWQSSFSKKLYEKFDLYDIDKDLQNFVSILPNDYKEKFDTDEAITDLVQIKSAIEQNEIKFNLEFVKTYFRLKIYNHTTKLTLSEIVPLIENIGFKIIDAQTFALNITTNQIKSWIYELSLSSIAEICYDSNSLKDNVEDTLSRISKGMLADDAINRLIVLSGLNWYQIKLLRSLSKYLHQTGFEYDKDYVVNVLIKHHQYPNLLLALFDAKFNPKKHSIELAESIKVEILEYLDNVNISAEDTILRHMLYIIEAIVRTNYYQLNGSGPKPYLSFKFLSRNVPCLKQPIPYAEIFVYSKDFEAIHLRAGKVARGGIRWSDRAEDYRREVLGLMKSQFTKNPVIVPTGSKGGFFVVCNNDEIDRDEYMAKGIESYQNFLRGMLDITDNVVDSKIIHPKDTVIYDDEDPYLVVAADKGTATFSDYANAISKEYNFWLGDAFASGGSAGYDHKKMAITAKGAWIAVQNHFKSMNIDVQSDVFTVIGIGDMSGDVFGNGMLLSKAIKLIAAFNHKHIFIDPNPDPELSFIERQRLFNLKRSQWSDYNPSIISQGGGVFERSAKLINVSKEIRYLLNIEQDQISPEGIIKAMLKAKVDLIWNGGIGTYIKSSLENNLDIGDKVNDNVRCNGKDIRAKVIAEGGNLGISQLGRIEYSLNGGRINTDFIDNSAGVDCSDHEVNIKIALDKALAKNKCTLQERNILLASMTEEVADLVLKDNDAQTTILSIAESSAKLNIDLFSKLVSNLKKQKILDPDVEFLPSEAELAKRVSEGFGITRPEIAIMLSYSKIAIYQELINAELVHDKYFEDELINYFPKQMHERFREEILSHQLRDEIIATILTNKIVNHLVGSTMNIIASETGAVFCDIVRAYIIACKIFDVENLWNQVKLLPNTVSNDIRIDMFNELIKIMRRGILWFIQNSQYPMQITKTIDDFSEKIKDLNKTIGSLLSGNAKTKYNARIKKYAESNIDSDLSQSIATLDSSISTLDIIYIAKNTSYDESNVSTLYFSVSNYFNVDWLRRACDTQSNNSYWNRLSIRAIKDDLYNKQRRLIIHIIHGLQNGEANLHSWIKKNQKYTRIFSDFVNNLKDTNEINLNMLILASKKFEMLLCKL
ncbi:MAG: NAD-glutamate dehydrogenase [Rickettsiaceae bacterium]